MVFQVQPSNKRKKSIGRRHKQGLTFAAHQDALHAATSEGDPEELPDTANEAVGDAIPRSASSKARKDDNWRSNRSVKSAKRAAAKAIAERNAVRVDIATTRVKLQHATACVKQVEHEQYLDRKASRVHALKTEEEHKLALDQLSQKYYQELEAAEEAAGVQTAKRLAEEARRIESEDNHSRLLRGERQHYANKVEREQAKLDKERRGQQLQIDHLHNQWKQQLAVSTMKLEQENQKSEETLKKERTKLINKLEKKEQMLDTVKEGNKKR